MKTKLLCVTALGLLTAACGQGNLYSMSADQAYAKLVDAKIERSGKGPFGTLPIAAVGDGSGTIKYMVTGMKMCEANIAAEGDKSRISAFCDQGGEGAAAGMTQNLMRSRLIEHIDATLNDRAFDPRLALGTTAGSWPEDPRQPNGSIGAAATEALKMERDIKRDLKEMEEAQAVSDAEAAERAKQAEAHKGVTFQPGKPMIQTSN